MAETKKPLTQKQALALAVKWLENLRDMTRTNDAIWAAMVDSQPPGAGVAYFREALEKDAGPELLEACKRAVEFLERDIHATGQATRAALYAAIAKATGK